MAARSEESNVSQIAMLALGAQLSTRLTSRTEELWRAALISRDMRVGVTQHGSPGRRDVCKRECVRCPSGRHQKHHNFALKKLRQTMLN
jgi:hypothetical protein